MNRIKKLRKERGYTQEQLAELLGLNAKSSIANYESGANAPRDEIKIKMCELFNCTMDYLMGLTNEKEPISESWGMEEKIEEIAKIVSGLKCYEWNAIKVAIDKKFSSEQAKVQLNASPDEIKKAIKLNFFSYSLIKKN